jgi:hypothetical protein
MPGLSAARGESLLKIVLIYVTLLHQLLGYMLLKLYMIERARMMDFDGHRIVWSWLVCSG